MEFEGQEFVVPTSWECLGRGSQENVIVDLPYVEEYVEIILEWMESDADQILDMFLLILSPSITLTGMAPSQRMTSWPS